LFLSCNKHKNEVIAEKQATDSLTYYMRVVNSENIAEKQKTKALDKSVSLVSSLKNTKKNRDTLFSLMLNYYNLKEWDKYQLSSKILFKNSLLSKDSVNLAKNFRYKGSYYKRMEVYDSSFYYYLKSEKLYLKLKDDSNYANILMNKGIVQFFVSDYLGAELSLSKAYYIFKDSKEKEKLYGTLNQLGLVCNELKEYERAADYHNKALEVVREFNLKNEEHQEAVCYNNLGYLYIKQKEFLKAIPNFETALLDKTVKVDDPISYAYLIDNLAYCRLQTNNHKDLPRLFYEALELRIKLKSDTEIIGSYIHLSEYYQKLADNKSAIAYSDKAISLAKVSKIPVNIILALKQASIVDKKNAVKYSEGYIRISDSLQVVERNSKDRFARLQLETDEIKKENVFLEEKNRDFLNYFAGTIVFSGFLFFMRAQRARRRETILKQAQQQANEDIYKLIISQQGKLDEGRIMEKTRIAKELHDGVLGRIFGLRLNLDGLNQRSDEEAIQERIRCLEELKIIEQDLREISHELSREKYVLINNFVAIVNNLLDEQIKINNAVLTAMIGENIDWDSLSNTTKINLYRILQECLQNINKYAKAKTIKVEFKKDKKGNLILNIVDDGIGFETQKESKGIGLENIVARTHESEGIIEIKSEKNIGTHIKITVPLEHKLIKV
jgi:signal transduction histidine kinase